MPRTKKRAFVRNKKGRKPAFKRTKRAMRSKNTGVISEQVAIYHPGRSHTFMPRKFFTSYITTYGGIMAAANWGSAGGGSGGQFNSAAFNMLANSVLNPMGSITPVSWMNATTPGNSTNSTVLFSNKAYTKSLVYKTVVTWMFNPSVTASNDGIICTLVPTDQSIANGAPDYTVTAARQPFMKQKYFVLLLTSKSV